MRRSCGHFCAASSAILPVVTAEFAVSDSHEKMRIAEGWHHSPLAYYVTVRVVDRSAVNGKVVGSQSSYPVICYCAQSIFHVAWSLHCIVSERYFEYELHPNTLLCGHSAAGLRVAPRHTLRLPWRRRGEDQ